LINDGMDIHALARQMGTSIGMIERHYSHLTPRMKKDMFTGDERQPSWPVPTTTLAGGSGRKTGMPVWRAAPPA